MPVLTVLTTLRYWTFHYLLNASQVHHPSLILSLLKGKCIFDSFTFNASFFLHVDLKISRKDIYHKDSVELDKANISQNFQMTWASFSMRSCILVLPSIGYVPLIFTCIVDYGDFNHFPLCWAFCHFQSMYIRHSKTVYNIAHNVQLIPQLGHNRMNSYFSTRVTYRIKGFRNDTENKWAW